MYMTYYLYSSFKTMDTFVLENCCLVFQLVVTKLSIRFFWFASILWFSRILCLKKEKGKTTEKLRKTKACKNVNPRNHRIAAISY